MRRSLYQRRTRAVDSELETIGSLMSIARPVRSTLTEAGSSSLTKADGLQTGHVGHIDAVAVFEQLEGTAVSALE